MYMSMSLIWEFFGRYSTKRVCKLHVLSSRYMILNGLNQRIICGLSTSTVHVHVTNVIVLSQDLALNGNKNNNNNKTLNMVNTL